MNLPRVKAVLAAALFASICACPATEAAPDEAKSLESLNDEVVRLYGLGRFDEMIALAERSLALSQKVLGPEHPDVALALNNLGAAYQAKGDYARAEPLYERSLAIREPALGPEHPDVAGSLNNLALLFETNGDYARAEPLFERSLAIRE